ncbi:Rho-binding antiterminator [Psychromonas aquatilis]|uniref:Rho-binding antiterminator n=1 Tax=Psychromonas aquatilis TaxID=2005072 RepID=A0ABU9GQI9_9GAMM
MISCQQYDYIELVCMYHYPLLLTLTSGQPLEGIAGDECILIKVKDQHLKVVLTEITTLTVTVTNPHLTTIRFE